MGFNQGYETFTEEQRQVLSQYVTDCDSHIFALKNLPEVIKGALFSRYSRSYLGLRSLLLKEFIGAQEAEFHTIASNAGHLQEEAVYKAQAFYDRILDGYGDDSIGELGGAHLAIENVSMLAAKKIEDARIGGSPLEKSTRYICFDRPIDGKFAYHRDPKIMQSEHASLYELTCDFLFQTYSNMIEPLTHHIQKTFPKDCEISEAAYHAALRAKVLDCLRGLLPASTLTNLGVFGNGRFFEKLLTDLSLSSLSEMKLIASSAQNQLMKIIPSFIRRADPANRHWPATQSYCQQLSECLQSQAPSKIASTKVPNHHTVVKLLDTDPQAARKVARSLLYEYSDVGLEELKDDEKDMKNIFNAISSLRLNRRHKSPRALEHAFYTFEIESDFGCYRDLQRHRMLTQQRQLLSCHLGYIVPQEIDEAGFGSLYREALDRARQTYQVLCEQMPQEAQYIVPMAYKVRWYFHINLRSLQWLCELRSSPAGHAEYRLVAQEMARQVIQAQPDFEPFFKFVDFDGHSLGRIDQENRRISKQRTC